MNFILEDIGVLLMRQIHNQSNILHIVERAEYDLFKNIKNNYEEVEKELVKLGYRISLSKYALYPMYTIEWM